MLKQSGLLIYHPSTIYGTCWDASFDIRNVYHGGSVYMLPYRIIHQNIIGLESTEHSTTSCAVLSSKLIYVNTYMH